MPTPTPKVDAILARFPGPVMLAAKRTCSLIGLAVSLGFAAFMLYLLFVEGVHRWRDIIMAPIALVFFAFLAGRALILLLVPSAASLTLDADGFVIRGIFRYQRTAWREVSGFRVIEGRGRYSMPHVVFEVPGRHPPTRPRRAPKGTHPLPYAQGFSDEDLAVLMMQWRERALGP